MTVEVTGALRAPGVGAITAHVAGSGGTADVTVGPDGRTLVTVTFRRGADAAAGIRAVVAVPAGAPVRVARWSVETSSPGVHGPVDALLGTARAGEALVAASAAVLVAPLVPGLELVDRGPRRWAGRPPERVYELRAPASEDASNLDWARRAVPGPVVGRDDEWRAVEAAWRGAGRGRARTVFVTGEAGIGKTTLAALAALRAHAEGAVVLYGRWDRGGTGAFGAVREALGTYADRCNDDRLHAELAGRIDDLTRLLPDVGARFDVEPATPSADPAADRLRMFESVVGWLERMTADRAALVVLDDLHWADEDSLLMLDHLHHSPVVMPVMVLVTDRDNENDRTAHPLVESLRDSESTTVALAGLDAGAVRRLVDDALGDGAPADRAARVTHTLMAGTAGNPLFVQHHLRYPPGAEVGDRAADRPVMSGDVGRAVRWRLGQLPPDTVDLLVAATVVGDPFDADLLAEAVGVPPLVVDRALQGARRAGLLQAESPTGHRFAHDVVPDVLRAGLSARRAAELHRGVGAALSARADASDEVRPHAVAEHCLRGVDGPSLERAVRWARRAAAVAVEGMAFAAAADLLTRAVEAHDRFAGDPGTACVLRVELTEAQTLARRFEDRDRVHLEVADPGSAR